MTLASLATSSGGPSAIRCALVEDHNTPCQCKHCGQHMLDHQDGDVFVRNGADDVDKIVNFAGT